MTGNTLSDFASRRFHDFHMPCGESFQALAPCPARHSAGQLAGLVVTRDSKTSSLFFSWSHWCPPLLLFLMLSARSRSRLRRIYTRQTRRLSRPHTRDMRACRCSCIGPKGYTEVRTAVSALWRGVLQSPPIACSGSKTVPLTIAAARSSRGSCGRGQEHTLELTNLQDNVGFCSLVHKANLV